MTPFCTPPLFLSLSRARALSLSLSLTHTHTHTLVEVDFPVGTKDTAPPHSVEYQGFVSAEFRGLCDQTCTLKVLKLIAQSKLTFDKRIVLSRVAKPQTGRVSLQLFRAYACSSPPDSLHTLHPATYTLHPTSHTQHPTPHTLYPTKGSYAGVWPGLPRRRR